MQVRFEGIVLFNRPHHEKDALVKIFTQSHGTKMFFIKNYYHSNQALKKHLIPLTCHKYLGIINEEGLSFLKEAETVNNFPLLQKDYLIHAHAAYITQLIDASIEDGQTDGSLYDFYKNSLTSLNEGVEARALQVLVELQLLQRFGVGLDWNRCVECGNRQHPFDFSMRLQGLLCQQHLHLDDFRLHLQPNSLVVVQKLAQVKVNQLGKINLTQQTYEDLRRLMREIFHEMVGIRLKSESYLDQLYRLEGEEFKISKR